MEYLLRTHWNQLTAVEQKIAFAEQLLQGVASATQTLLTINNYEASIQTSLKTLGQATLVDRVYIFRNHLHPETREPLVSQTWEWVKDGVKSEIDNPDLQDLCLKEFAPRWYQELSQGRDISGLVKNFPDEERAYLEPQKILSIVIVPIQIQSMSWGFMGFDDCDYGHDWTNSEVAVLKSIANSFGGAFVRHQVEQDLIKKNIKLKQQQIELQAAKVEAERANETKNSFLAKVSHELRTPMNGILGYAQILERSSTLNHREQRGVQVIYQCANHLLMLINDLLDISRIEAKTLELSLENVHLYDLIHQVIAVCQVRAESKDVSLTSVLSPDLPEIVSTDAQRLKQVLINLIHNAIKFTDQGQATLHIHPISSHQEIRNAVEVEICQLKFAVKDTGIGIASDNIEMLFGAFEQLQHSQGQSDGVGLGLSISQEIIQAMGSSIEVQSELNVGSTFSFELNLPIVHHSIGSKKTTMIEAVDETFNDTGNRNTQLAETVKILLPHPSILNNLKSLAQSGRLKKLMEVTENSVANTPEHQGFVCEIHQLAKQFKLEELEQYLDQCLDESKG